VTADTGHPVSLRVTLRQLNAALEDAADAHYSHRSQHGCREGSGCARGIDLGGRVVKAQGALDMTRFLNGEG
jgi:hypothetical protein